MINRGEYVEWKTINGYYYYLRPIFLKKGINPEVEGKKFRENITAAITQICKDMGTTREDLKIIAKVKNIK